MRDLIFVFFFVSLRLLLRRLCRLSFRDHRKVKNLLLFNGRTCVRTTTRGGPMICRLSFLSLPTNERTGKETKRHPEKPLLKSFLREERDLFSTTLNVSLSLVHKKKLSPLLFFLLLSLLGLYYYDSTIGCVRGSSARKYDDALETTTG